MANVYQIRLSNGASLEVYSEDELVLKVHDFCIFNRDFFIDIGEVMRVLKQPSMTANPRELPKVDRIATLDDIDEASALEFKNNAAMKTTAEWVDNLKLPMNLINSHYTLDGKMVTIQFSADGRVDFRELVKELARALGVRIELRQIGVRDETSIFGGIGVCGQILCCCRFLKDFDSINVKMAKDQDLALTPATISGVCGRLKCCLKFEHECYLELQQSMPRKGDVWEAQEGKGKVVDRNLLTGRITVSFENGSTRQYDARSGERTPINKNDFCELDSFDEKIETKDNRAEEITAPEIKHQFQRGDKGKNNREREHHRDGKHGRMKNDKKAHRMEKYRRFEDDLDDE